MKKLKWYECAMSDNDILQGELFKFQKAVEDALSHSSWPDDAALFAEAAVGKEGVKLWITDTAVTILEQSGFKWRDYYARELPSPPLRNESSLLVGHDSSWNLLRKGGKDPFK